VVFSVLLVPPQLGKIANARQSVAREKLLIGIDPNLLKESLSIL